MSAILYGRDAEIEHLTGLAKNALDRACPAVLIEGPAGIGKSALLVAFIERMSGEGWKAIHRSFRASGFRGPMSALVQIALHLGAGQPPAEWTLFDEVFLLSKNGLLIYHSGSGSSAVDEDILGSMLSAVQDFVRDSFGDRERKGGLDKLSYKGLQILIEHGEFTFIAAVVSRGEHSSMRSDISTALHRVETEHRALLESWDGDLSRLTGVEEVVEGLMSARYPKPRLEGEAAIAQQNLRFEWFRSAVSAYASQHPTLLVIEDIQEADRTSQSAIRYLARGTRDLQLLLVLTARTEGLEEDLEQILGSLEREGRLSRMRLSELSKSAVRSLLSKVLEGGELSEGLVEEIYSASGGRPQHVMAFVEMLQADGRLSLEAGLWVIKGRKGLGSIAVPETMRRSMESLPLTMLSVLEFASVLDEPIEEEVLLGGLKSIDPLPAQALEGCVRAGYIARTDVTYRLSKPGLRETILAGMGALRMVAWHRAAARAILSTHPGEEEEAVFSLARHFTEGHLPEEGIGYCMRAGEIAESGYAFSEAARLFSWAVEMMERTGGHPQYIETLSRWGSAMEIDGNFRGAIDAYSKIVGMEDAPSQAMGEALMHIGRLHQKMGEYENAKAAYDSSIELLRDSPLLLARARNGLGSLIVKEDPREGLVMHLQYLEAAEAADSQKDVAEAYRWAGGACFHAGDVNKALEYWQSALRTYDALGDDFGRSTILYNMGAAYSIQGDQAKSLESLKEAVRLKRKLGDLKGMASALNNLGITYSRIGNTAEAIEAHKRSLEVKARIGDLVGVAISYHSLGMLFLDEGDYSRAAEQFAHKLEITERVGDVRGAARARTNLAEALCSIGDIEDAEAHATTAWKVAQQHGFLELRADLSVTKARLAAGRGDWATAEQLFKEAFSLSEGLKDPRSLGMAYFAAAKEWKRRDHSLSTRYLEKAVALLERAGSTRAAEQARALLIEHGASKGASTPPA
ncbi:MAG: tetratricopeptide repeat protein [Candidatus Thermoplasmatota archaeon]